MDCLFCNIVKGVIPSCKVYEDDDTFVFLDISPVTKGHCLIIPKQHFKSIFDIDDETLKKVIVAAKKVSEKIKQSLKSDGIRLSQSNGKAAGQDVMHFHLHVIPRYKDDGVLMSETTTAYPRQTDFKELKKLALQLHSG